MEADAEALLEEPFAAFAKTKHASTNYMRHIMTFFNYWFKVPQAKFEELVPPVHKFCTYLVIMDDILDDGVLRSGTPCLHTIFGSARTSNSALYGLMDVVKTLNELAPDIIGDCIKLWMKIYQGNSMEMYYRNNFMCPTEEQYLNVICMKAFGPLQFVIRLFQKFGTESVDVDRISVLMGQLLQLWNDYVNLISEKTATAKTYCEDVTEGKFSFPIIHAIRNHPEDEQLLKILKQRTDNDEMKKYFVSLLMKYNSFEYTLEVINTKKNDLIEEIEKVGGNPLLEHGLEFWFELMETVG